MEKLETVSYGVEILTENYLVMSQYTHLTDGRTELRQQYHVLHYKQSHGKNDDDSEYNTDRTNWSESTCRLKISPMYEDKHSALKTLNIAVNQFRFLSYSYCAVICYS